MLQSLLVENFQAHERFSLTLDPGVTTVCGPSDRGKSALLRALKWLMLNRPAGDSFLRHGSKRVHVRLQVDGGRVSRSRGSGGNLCKLNGQCYVALKPGTVPEAMAAILNVDALSFQSQFDGPFWLCLTPGQVSRELNAIVDLDVIDRTLANLAARARRAKAEAAVIEDRLKAAAAERDRLAWTASAAADLETASKFIREVDIVRARRSWLMNLLAEAKRTVQGAEVAAQAKKRGSLAVQTASLAAETGRKAASLRSLLAELAGAEADAAARRGLADRAAADLARRTGGRCPVCGAKKLPTI